MSGEENVRVGRELTEAFNAGDYGRMEALLAPDSIYTEPATGRRLEGWPAIEEALQGWRTAFPDARGTVEAVVADGNRVAFQIMWQGTHTGPLGAPGGTIPATGKSMSLPAAQFLIFEHGKVKSNTHYFDLMAMLQQIGAVPAAR